ncbi:HIT family protein [Pediococcus pentosaceus]|uniref:HIT family protein n=1 Tax=Pediococcus pentosaceus TaxID=1255 RepID=UPI002FBEBDB9
MKRDPNCVFCQKTKEDYIVENKLAASFLDFYPVSKGHTLIVPKRHVRQLWELNEEERHAIFKLVEKNKAILDQEYQPDGYNVVVNSGAAAGQSVFHCHIHLIPRYWNEDPKRKPVPGQFLVPPERPQFKGMD